MLDLGPEARKLEAPELLQPLRDQFGSDVEDLKQSIAAWKHMLAEDDHVSVIEWFNPRAIR